MLQKRKKQTEKLTWHFQYFSCTETLVSQLKQYFSVLLISWLGHENPGTRQPLSSFPLAYHCMLVCLFSHFTLFYAPPLFQCIPILQVLRICRLHSCTILMCFTMCSQRKSPSKSHAELDHRNPAVHSQGPLLLLAVCRPTWWGTEREKDWVAGGGVRGQQGAQISQLLVHKLCPLSEIQQISRKASTYRGETADRKWIEMVLFKWDTTCAWTTKLFFFCWLQTVKFCMLHHWNVQWDKAQASKRATP